MPVRPFTPSYYPALTLHLISMTACLVSALFWTGCSNDNPAEPSSDAGGYELITRSLSIKSYRNGGGILLVCIEPNENFKGTVSLSLEADSSLHARLGRSSLDASATVAEITVNPDQTVEFKSYPIRLTAVHNSETTVIEFEVVIIDYDPPSTGQHTMEIENFVIWFDAMHPQHGLLADEEWDNYCSQPDYDVVSHWICLSDEWELQLCYHVYIPPYDWALFLLRKRDYYEPILAARRESGGAINQIPVNEYP